MCIVAQLSPPFQTSKAAARVLTVLVCPQKALGASSLSGCWQSPVKSTADFMLETCGFSAKEAAHSRGLCDLHQSHLHKPGKSPYFKASIPNYICKCFFHRAQHIHRHNTGAKVNKTDQNSYCYMLYLKQLCLSSSSLSFLRTTATCNIFSSL